jgi:hypothetical protein
VQVPYQELVYGFEGKVIETASKAESPSKGGLTSLFSWFGGKKETIEKWETADGNPSTVKFTTTNASASPVRSYMGVAPEYCAPSYSSPVKYGATATQHGSTAQYNSSTVQYNPSSTIQYSTTGSEPVDVTTSARTLAYPAGYTSSNASSTTHVNHRQALNFLVE